MSDLNLGIDIGVTGGVSIVHRDHRLLWTGDLPSLPDGLKGRLAINAALLTLIVRQWEPKRAYVEFVSSRPTDSRTAAFSFGRARGTVEGVLGACAVPITWITVPTWRKAVQLPPGASKDHCRGRAIQLWPGFAESFSRTCDADRAESALIGLAGLMREAANV
jgi:hypothetical protein